MCCSLKLARSEKHVKKAEEDEGRDRKRVKTE